jgi:hypothetical protein
MSAFKTIQTKMKRVDCLVDALGKVKKEWAGKMHVDPQGDIRLQGYHGDDRSLLPKTDKNYAPPCVVRIPRKIIGGSSNDIGVAVGKDGNLELYISDYDSHQYGTEFVNKVSQMYGLVEGVVEAIEAGCSPVSDMVPLQNVPNLTGKIMGVRMSIPRSMAMQMTQ